jgi:transposase
MQDQPEKKAKGYRDAFRLNDPETGKYVGVGHSAKPEIDAFRKATKMVSDISIHNNPIALDKYLNSRSVLKLFGKRISFFVIPGKNISKIGLKCKNL